MYGFFAYPLEALTSGVGNYVAVSHAGHGLNSYALNYHLVYGRLALFTQTLWGGVYADSPAHAEKVNDQLARCARLIAAYESCAAAELLPAAPARLIVVETDLGGDGTSRWLPGPLPDNDTAQAWLDAPRDTSLPPTEAALDLLVSGPVSETD